MVKYKSKLKTKGVTKLSNEYLDFKAISEQIKFSDLLDSLNVPYQLKNGELHSNGMIVNINKNMFFVPKNDDLKGSVINFYANFKEIDLRTAASELKKQFLTKPKERKRELPDLKLEWTPYLEKRGISEQVFKEYEVGLVKQKSVVAGKISFKVYDENGSHTGYIGYKEEDGSWFFPKGFKRTLYNVQRLQDKKSVIVTVDPFDALRLVSLGFNQVTSLLAKSMTDEQAEQLNKFKYILLFHPEPTNVINRLFTTSFIKAPVLSKPLKEYSDHELQNLIKPA